MIREIYDVLACDRKFCYKADKMTKGIWKKSAKILTSDGLKMPVISLSQFHGFYIEAFIYAACVKGRPAFIRSCCLPAPPVMALSDLL